MDLGSNLFPWIDIGGRGKDHVEKDTARAGPIQSGGQIVSQIFSLLNEFS